MRDWQEAVAILQQACRDAFGVPVVYFPSLRNHPERAGCPIEVIGILDEQRENVSLMGSGDNGLEAIVPRTTLELRPADLGFDPLVGDEVTVAGVSYRVREVNPDGSGSAILTLDRLSTC
ncbi:MAG: hypothetical protein HQL56_09835 [Magnetococcales bacterium]|nr:hypothetical protein [Magnetococcales bacterium]